ncbi:SixA phosphatase family protein [Chitinilyticum piscinae]|uniref:Histidine phosphatase family protein n=1 Tax=Chitinilyticum piscinae TaxID=2866724 RepID=A0A8J7FI92_9NEIS|nr:histidine phosphatase family protein [Chitinilyticum piscinae]MBE9608282.1 histidine phosphatase family protein [Chitinilyticum piscinae]
MDLILWRHAEAEETASTDLARALTGKGRKQASRMAKWLRTQLAGRDADVVLYASQARRSQETANALGWPVSIDARLNPDSASAARVLETSQWPQGGDKVVIIVGHQPMLGRTASLLLGGVEQETSVKKGGIWWFQRRERDGEIDFLLKAMVAPDLLAGLEE